MQLGKQAVTRLRADFAESGTSMVRDWDNATSTVILGCNFQPLGTSENDTDREFAEDHFRIYAPAGTDILSTDRVIVNGTTYEVNGDGQPFADLRSKPHHVEFDVLLRQN